MATTGAPKAGIARGTLLLRPDPADDRWASPLPPGWRVYAWLPRYPALVPGDVDDAETATARQIQFGIAELDRDAALAFLAQAVGVLAGQQRDEGGLAVVDVAGGAQRQHGRIVVC